MNSSEHPFPNLLQRSKEGGGVYVGNSYWREVDSLHMMAMLTLVSTATKLGINLILDPVLNDAKIARSRSRAASKFLQSPADVFLTLDGDIEFDPIQILRICEGTFEFDMIGGAYVKRSGHKPELAIRLLPGQIVFAEESGLVEVDYLSTGCMATHRRVVEAIASHMNPVHQSGEFSYTPMFGDYVAIKHGEELFDLSEDWAFVQRAKDEGFKPYLDPRVRMRHWGLYDFTLEDAVRPLRDDPGIIVWKREGKNEYVGYAPQPRVVKTKDGFLMHLLRNDGVSDVIEKNLEWEPEVAAAVREHVGPGVKFLDIGANLGYFSLLAASLGADVIAIEPNETVRKLMSDSAQENGWPFPRLAQAVSNTKGKFTLSTQGLNNQGEAFLTMLNEKAGPTVEVYKLNQLLSPDWRPDVIKMDIEGEEWNAIQGSPEIFEQTKVVIFEYSPEQLRRGSQMDEPAELIRWFELHGFLVKPLSEHETYCDWIAIKV